MLVVRANLGGGGMCVELIVAAAAAAAAAAGRIIARAWCLRACVLCPAWDTTEQNLGEL